MIVDFGLGVHSSVTAHRLPLIAHCLLPTRLWRLDLGLRTNASVVTDQWSGVS